MQFFTQNDVPSDLLQKSFAANIAVKAPRGMAPLWGISGMAAKKSCSSTTHGWWTKTLRFPSVTINQVGGYLSTDTTLTVTSTQDIVPNMLMRYQVAYNGASLQHTVMAEIIFVDQVLNSTTLVVIRGFAGTTAQAIPTATQLQVCGSASEHGSQAPLSKAISPTYATNYTQIFRDSWDVSRTLKQTSLYAGYDSVSDNKKDCVHFHSYAVESAAFFGRKAATTRNGKPMLMADGIESMIQQNAPTNLWEAGATTTFAQLEAMSEPTLDTVTNGMDGNDRVIFCGSTALTVFNGIGRINGTTFQDVKTNKYGLQFRTFRTTRGEFQLVEHPMFNTNADWKKMAVIMDLSSFDFTYLAGEETSELPIHTENGTDATGGVLTTELTYVLTNPEACGIIYNLRAAA